MENKKDKSLSDYKEEIHKCSKCGLCQAVCPLFKTTGNECTVSRGQFIMLDGVIKGDLKLNGRINKYLDLCLKCNKCSDFCPSEIDVVDILLEAKHEYFKNSLAGKIYGFFESKFVFNTTLNIIRFFSKLLTFNLFRKKQKKLMLKAVYFGGCMSVIRPNMNKYVTTLLNKIGIAVLPTEFNCCGMPFLTTGNKDRFIEQAHENISKIPADCDLIITDCASCEWSWKQYEKYTGKSLNKNVKIKNLYDVIAENYLQFESDKELTLTYHKPCHTNDTTSENIIKIIKGIKNTKYKELEGMNECCGFASYEHPLSLIGTKTVRKWKAKHIKHTNADYVLTNCAGCEIALKLMQLKSHTKSRQLISFLKNNCKIK